MKNIIEEKEKKYFWQTTELYPELDLDIEEPEEDEDEEDEEDVDI